LQNCATQGRSVRYLQRKEAQATAGIRQAIAGYKAKKFMLLPALQIRYNVLFTFAAHKDRS
jgi:hypothetical protein